MNFKELAISPAQTLVKKFWYPNHDAWDNTIKQINAHIALVKMIGDNSSEFNKGVLSNLRTWRRETVTSYRAFLWPGRVDNILKLAGVAAMLGAGIYAYFNPRCFDDPPQLASLVAHNVEIIAESARIHCSVIPKQEALNTAFWGATIYLGASYAHHHLFQKAILPLIKINRMCQEIRTAAFSNLPDKTRLDALQHIENNIVK